MYTNKINDIIETLTASPNSSEDLVVKTSNVLKIFNSFKSDIENLNTKDPIKKIINGITTDKLIEEYISKFNESKLDLLNAINRTKEMLTNFEAAIEHLISCSVEAGINHDKQILGIIAVNKLKKSTLSNQIEAAEQLLHRITQLEITGLKPMEITRFLHTDQHHSTSTRLLNNFKEGNTKYLNSIKYCSNVFYSFIGLFISGCIATLYTNSIQNDLIKILLLFVITIFMSVLFMKCLETRAVVHMSEKTKWQGMLSGVIGNALTSLFLCIVIINCLSILPSSFSVHQKYVIFGIIAWFGVAASLALRLFLERKRLYLYNLTSEKLLKSH